MAASNAWFFWAALSACFAALTAIFAKIGIQGVDSDLATLVRTGIIVVVLSLFVWYAGKWSNPLLLPQKTWVFLTLSGLATGAFSIAPGDGSGAILLNSGGPQPCEPMLVDRHLPAQKFVDRQGIAAAGVFEGQQPAAHGRDDLRLAPDDPTLGRRWRQIGDGQRTAVRSDHIFDPWAVGIGHF